MHLGSSNKYLRGEFIRQGMVCPWNCRMNTVNIKMQIRGVPPEFRSYAAERGTRICRISEVNIETRKCGNPVEFRSSAAEPGPGIYSKYNTSFIV